MGFFDKDAEDMLEIYLLETSQLLEQADEILLRAEKLKRLTREDINGIFRVMHTIKSSSAMMGLSSLSTLAHRLEDIFDLLREDPAKIGQFDQESFDLMFDVTDFIKAELNAMQEESYHPADAEIFDSGIQVLLGKLREQKRHIVNIRFERDCKMENIRAYMVVRQIKGLCSKLEAYPQNMETDTSTAEYIRQNGCYISFISENPQNVLDKLQEALFVENCSLVDAMPQTLQEESEAMAAPASSEGEFIRVRAERLDRLQNLTGELMIAASSYSLLSDSAPSRDTISRQIEQLLKELEELVISIRMVPFTGIIPQINRAVRDICKKEKKEVSFTVNGEEAEIDKQIADRILDPLLHLIRNAVDHGIETPEERLAAKKKRAGSLQLDFLNASGEIQITVSDDGRGMDLEAIYDKAKQKNLCDREREEYSDEELLEMCLLPGFSTRDTANEFSGRGVGLDVVRQMVDQFGGHIHVTSKAGEGSQFVLHLPLTLTIIDSIRFHVGNCCFALPSHQVIHFFTYPPSQGNLVSHDGQEYWLWENRYLPVLFLEQIFHIGKLDEGRDIKDIQPVDQQPAKILIHIKGSAHEAVLVVDQIDAQESLVEKPLPAILGGHYKQYTGISGCSLLGDGSICMQMDAEDLIRVAGGGNIWK